MGQEQEVVEVLRKIIGETSDEERRRIEADSIQPYDSGIHDGDPLDQPEPAPEIEP